MISFTKLQRMLCHVEIQVDRQDKLIPSEKIIILSIQ
jgi:hypothetical protein